MDRWFVARAAASLTLAVDLVVVFVVTWVAPLAWPGAAQAEAGSDGAMEAALAAERARVAVIRKVEGTVVAVFGKERQGGGSGVVIHPEGYALTNFHVSSAAGAQAPSDQWAGLAGLADGKLYRWRLVGTDPGGDLSVIQLERAPDGPAFAFARLGDSDAVRVGQFVLAMGNPFVLSEDYRPTVTLGIVSGVHRFQPGAGATGKMLEYGDCIQVDSSINPGNSGGPLFNMRGEVIGINGRASFEERGRVNVGIGYAISANQCRNFLPELLATKIARHGTLDATFGNRVGGVVCTAVNLDSQASRNGLQVGDRLLRFQGVPIEHANQFTNLISTLPEGWPVELVLEREGQTLSFAQRLDASPVPLPQRPARAPQPRQGGTPRPQGKAPAPQPGEDSPLPGEGDAPPEPPAPPAPAQPRSEEDTPLPGEDPDSPPGKQPAKPPAAPQERPQPKAGVVLVPERNREAAERIVRAARAFLGGEEALARVACYRKKTEVFIDGKPAGRGELLAAGDGRFDERRFGLEGLESRTVWDGSSLMRLAPNQPEPPLRGAEALRDPDAAAARAVLMTLYGHRGWAWPAELTLEGADRSQGMAAYRLRVVDASGLAVLMWFSVDDLAADPALRAVGDVVRPLKVQRDGQPAASLWLGFAESRGVRTPVHRRVVRGLLESPLSEEFDRAYEALPQVPAGAFTLEGASQ